MRLSLISLLVCQIHLSNAQDWSENLVAAESVGMSSSALADATARLQKHIDDGEIAGVVAAVSRDGKPVAHNDRPTRTILDSTIPRMKKFV